MIKLSVLKVIFDYLSIYSDIIPAITFVFAFSKYKDKGLWVLFFFNLYSFSTNLIITTRWYEGLGLNFYLLYRFFTIIGYSLVAFFFYNNLSTPAIKKSLVFSYIIFVSYAIYDYLTSPGNSFDSIPSSLEAILIIILSIFYLFEQIKNPKVFFIYTLDKFWIVASLLVYHTGTLFLFIYAEPYFSDPTFNQNYVLINNSFLLLKNVVFSIGLLIKNKPDDYSSGSDYPGFASYLEKHF